MLIDKESSDGVWVGVKHDFIYVRLVLIFLIVEMKKSLNICANFVLHLCDGRASIFCATS